MAPSLFSQKWHRNPFFHTAVLPPSVNPSARPSADLESATAARVLAAAAANRSSATSPRASSERPGPSVQPGQPGPSGTNSADDAVQPGLPRIQLPPKDNSTPQGLLAEAAARASQQRQNEEKQQTSEGKPEQKREQQHHHHLGSLRASLNLNRASFNLNRASLNLHRPRRRKQLPKLTIREPSDRLTGYQFFYIFILDGLGAGILSGGINFAIAYAMYKTQDTIKHPVRLFQFPNTLCGDATLTIFIQCVLTWFIELVLVNRDLKSGHVQPIGFIQEPRWWPLRWFLLLDRHPPSPAPSESDLERPLSHVHDDNCTCHRHHEAYAPGSWQHWLVFLLSQLVRALLIGVVCFVFVWPPAIGIMTAPGTREGHDWRYYPPSWAPVLFKLVYGAVLAVLTTPLFAGFWLVRCGWAIQANHRHLDVSDQGV